MISGIVSGIQGSPKEFFLVLKTGSGIVQIQLDLEATKAFAQQQGIDAGIDDPKTLLKELSKKVFGKKVDISFS